MTESRPDKPYPPVWLYGIMGLFGYLYALIQCDQPTRVGLIGVLLLAIGLVKRVETEKCERCAERKDP